MLLNIFTLISFWYNGGILSEGSSKASEIELRDTIRDSDLPSLTINGPNTASKPNNYYESIMFTQDEPFGGLNKGNQLSKSAKNGSN